MWGLILFAFCINICVCTNIVCPKECDCDMDNGLNRAMCVDQNIVIVDVGIPKEVQVYSLSRNVISELENYCFKEIGYRSLKVLDLSNNLIFWIGLHAFAGLDQLTHLDLSNNRLRFIPPDLFWDTPKLEILDLSSNVFEKVKNEPLIMHTHLQVLYLNNCRIKFLPERLISRLPNLKKLDLSENYVITITVDVLKPLTKLESLELKIVHWECNSDLVAVETWILSQNIKYEEQCKDKSLQTSERLRRSVQEFGDTDEVWNITVENNTVQANPNETRIFVSSITNVKDFFVGVQLGLFVGIAATCLCYRKILIWCIDYCRRRRRLLNERTEFVSVENSRPSNDTNIDIDISSLTQRRLSLPVLRFSHTSIVDIQDSQVDANGSETPPPAYDQCICMYNK